jgi:hypothetical protein
MGKQISLTLLQLERSKALNQHYPPSAGEKQGTEITITLLRLETSKALKSVYPPSAGDKQGTEISLPSFSWRQARH